MLNKFLIGTVLFIVCGTAVLVERLQSIASSLGLQSMLSSSGCDLTIHSPLDVFRVQIQLKDSTASILSKQRSDKLVRSVTVSKNNNSTVGHHFTTECKAYIIFLVINF